MRRILTIAFWLAVTTASGQSTLQGTIRDQEQNQPLSGVNVVIKGITRGSVTNTEGKYALELPSGTWTIVASFVGYSSQEKTVTLPAGEPVDFMLVADTTQLNEIVVLHPTRGNEFTATTYVNLDAPVIQKQNFGQDLPFLLNWTPSVVTTSDAGAGVGYTGIRIRGSDATRVNVTINGIPYNDSESQSTFWVDIPDIASSTQSIQVQRGVGTSTNGAGAFGASINLDTQTGIQQREDGPYAEAILGAGSFGTQRYTLKGGYRIGALFLEGKLSKIKSDGYIERASSDLGSYYFKAALNRGAIDVDAIFFGGSEKTYQAWYGVDEATLQTNRRMNFAGAIYDSIGSITRYYQNQVDDYKQDHGQLHLGWALSERWDAKVSLHGTYGRGFYEEYHQNRTFASVGLPDFMGNESTDMVLRKWLNNYFYGLTYSLAYTGNRSGVVIGGAASWYEPARHYGEIIWTALPNSIPPGYRYYQGLSDKGDRNVFVKWNYRWNDRVSSFVDLQYRGVNYTTSGIQDDQSAYAVDDRFDFFNPKVGVTYQAGKRTHLYASYSIANREPNRSDYLGAAVKPRPERLYNLETGMRRRAGSFDLDVNYFLMQYHDQLVQTGALDPAGYPIRANVGSSFRTGVEASGLWRLSTAWSWNVNAAWSVNQNRDYIVFENGVPVPRNTRIILSPDIVTGSQLTWKQAKGPEVTWLSKYVGDQYLDNTESASVKLAGYWINDLRLRYEIAPRGFHSISWSLLINNFFDVQYASNGYSYGGVPYFYPQAGRNFMAMMTVRI